MHTPKTYKDYFDVVEKFRYSRCESYDDWDAFTKEIAIVMADVANDAYDEAIIDLGRLNHVG